MTEITFTPEQQQIILQIARESGSAEIRREAQKDYSTLGKTHDLLFVPGGVFVTFKINGELRGCIGCFTPTESLYKLIQEYAIHACNDYRFHRMTPKQFDSTTISVSVLSVPKDITNPLENVIAGKHGIIVSYNGCRGTYLPQVATEQEWDTKTFCEHCAYRKAGIRRTVDVLHDERVHWQTYTATIVSE